VPLSLHVPQIFSFHVCSWYNHDVSIFLMFSRLCEILKCVKYLNEVQVYAFQVLVIHCLEIKVSVAIIPAVLLLWMPNGKFRYNSVFVFSG
jgi:hypothetical protein